MNDYTTPWTDERFYAYFDITADEQKIIETFLKLKRGETVELGKMSEELFAWSKKWITGSK